MKIMLPLLLFTNSFFYDSAVLSKTPTYREPIHKINPELSKFSLQTELTSLYTESVDGYIKSIKNK